MGRGAVRMAHLYVSAADHPCLLNGGRFAPERVTRIGVDADGLCDLSALAAALAAHDREEGLALVAIHLANNETGVIQPVREISAIGKAAGGVLVLDAVQAAGRVPLDLADGLADYLILSSHKMGGPMGAGAFVAASDLMMPAPLVTGGGQEKGHRAGTENLAGIAGFGAAAREAREHLADAGEIAGVRDRIEATILSLAPDAEIFGRAVARIANTVFFEIPGMKAETLQIGFDLAGVAVSAGSACSSGRVGPSHVLKAMGRESEGALRVSIGRGTTLEDTELFGVALSQIMARRPDRTTRAA
jgi:cysteine desulfurase